MSNIKLQSASWRIQSLLLTCKILVIFLKSKIVVYFLLMDLIKKYYLILIAFFVMVLVGGSYFYLQSRPTNLISPVLGVPKLRLATNLWFPKDNFFSKEVSAHDEEELTAKAAFFVETNSGQVLFEKDSHQKLPIASLTKIMTAIVALENKETADLLTVSERAAGMEPDKMYLKPGEKLTLKELLEGIFLVSGNDASEVLAEGSTGRREEFISLMNSKADQLGMKNSLFINPSGLEEDGLSEPGKLIEHYSTAYDVALMSRFAIKKWPFLVDISSKPEIFIPENSTHQAYQLYNGINLLTTYPGVLGFKTGFTPEAGLTLVTLARRGEYEVVGVLLGSTNRRDDAKLLLDYSFAKLGL